MTYLRLIPVVAALLAGAASAAPKVATDIPVVHSIATAVMEGVGEPSLIMAPGASPHGYAMRPSEAAALAEADLIFWIGPALTPWLERAIETLGGDAAHVALMNAQGVRQLPFRAGHKFEAHSHGEDEDGHGHGRDEDKHDEHGHDDEGHEHEREDAHAHDEHEHDDHGHDDHGGETSGDPHIWLDPVNGQAIAAAMAAALGARDPRNAALYQANAARLSDRIEALKTKVNDLLAPARGRPFIVFHDAYHHFEARFDFEAAGAISLSDAAAPGPQRIEAIREIVKHDGVVCAFAEPQFEQGLIERILEGTTARIGVLDPQGATLTPGASLYPDVLSGVAEGLSACLAP